jgi:hypothetical protein
MEKAAALKDTPKHKKGVLHHLPSRTRYRIARRHRTEEMVAQIRDQVATVPGVKAVEVNERTGSVFVHHEERADILNAIGGALSAVADDLFEEGLEAEIEPVPGLSLLAKVLKSRAGKFDELLSEKTDNLIDFKMLVPMLFLGAGILKVTKTRNWFEQVPAWVLFYYAYDTYLKFHPPTSTKVASEFQAASDGTVKAKGRLKG